MMQIKKNGFDIPIPDEEGYLFCVPPRMTWEEFIVESELGEHYTPEDDAPLVFRKVR